MATTKKPASAAAAKDAKPTQAKPVKPAPVVAPEPAPKAVEKKAVATKTAVAAGPAKKVAPAKSAAAAKKVAVKSAAKPAANAKAVVGTVQHDIDPEKRANYIEVCAFYIAERRGFSPGNPEQDYLDAAAEIDRLIAAGHFSK